MEPRAVRSETTDLHLSTIERNGFIAQCYACIFYNDGQGEFGCFKVELIEADVSGGIPYRVAQLFGMKHQSRPYSSPFGFDECGHKANRYGISIQPMAWQDLACRVADLPWRWSFRYKAQANRPYRALSLLRFSEHCMDTTRVVS